MHLVSAVPFAVLDFISAFAYFDVFSVVRLDDFFSTYNKGTYVPFCYSSICVPSFAV